ncbi:MAG: F0F1 ATP synthase subunit delta [Steroidobacteraceae bacterium]
MAEKATIARPYARAAFEHAQAQNKLAQWSESLAVAATVVAEPTVSRLLNHPGVTPAQLVELITEAGGARFDEGTRNFVGTLASNRRLGLLPHIAAMYEVLRADVENVADVEVTSAVTLDQAQQQRLAAALKTRLKRDVRLHCKVDPALVGGAVIRSGDLVIDGSVRERLARLAGAVTH